MTEAVRQSNARRAVALLVIAAGMANVLLVLLALAGLSEPAAIGRAVATAAPLTLEALQWGVLLVQVDLLALWIVMGSGPAWLRALVGLAGGSVVTVLVQGLLITPEDWEVAAGHPFLALAATTALLGMVRGLWGLSLTAPDSPRVAERRTWQFSVASLLGWTTVVAVAAAVFTILAETVRAQTSPGSALLGAFGYAFPSLPFMLALLYPWRARGRAAFDLRSPGFALGRSTLQVLRAFALGVISGMIVVAIGVLVVARVARTDVLPVTLEHLVLLTAAITLLRYHGIRLSHSTSTC